MPTALLMANLQAAVKATASQGAAPATVCQRVKGISPAESSSLSSTAYSTEGADIHTAMPATIRRSWLILQSRHLGARELQERIMEELRAFTGGDFGDDVTLVVVAAE